MSRFRSNIILSGATAPWLENHYAHLVSKALPSSNEQPHRFSLVKACERCKVVSIDQQSAVALQPKEPLKSLVQLQKKMFAPNTMPERGAYFGQNMVLTERHATGIIKVGDVFSFTS